MIKRFIVILLLAVAAASCSTIGSGDTEEVKGAVKRYAALLSQGYASMNMTGLTQAAEEPQVAKVYFHMAALGEGRLRMMSELKDISFRDVRFGSATSASVKTREVWDFRHVNIDTGKVERDEKGFVYRMDYHLAKKNGAWLVRDAASEAKGEQDAGKKAAPPVPAAGGGAAR